MVLVRPVTRTRISTETFGHPVFDWITANTPTAWTTATLQNGWVHEYPMQYRKVGDVVFIRGTIKDGTMNSNITTLPVGYRLATLNRIGVFGMLTGTGTVSTARLDVQTSGVIALLNGAANYTWFMNFSYSTL